MTRQARIWHLGTALHHQREFSHMAFSPDGKTVFTRDDNAARLWDAATGKLPLQDWYDIVAFSPDGRTVLTGRGNTGQLWDVATGQPLGPALRQPGKIMVVAFSPDGATFAIGSEKVVQIGKLPPPVQGKPDQIILWAQVVTGMEIDDHGTTSVLDGKTWSERRERLAELGGLPVP